MIWPQGAYPLTSLTWSGSNLHTPPTNNTNKACFLGSRCDSNYAPTVYLKPRTLSRRFWQFFSAYDTFLIKAQFITTSDHPRYFESFRPYFLLNHHISANPYQNKPFQAINPKILKTNQNVQMFSTTLTMIHKESSFNVKPTKILSDFSGRGLLA